MFRKKNQTTGDPAAVQADPAPAPADLTGVLTDDEHDALASELTASGRRAKATVTSVQFGGNFDLQGCLWRTGLRVQPVGGEPFDAEIALLSFAYDEEFQPWKVGDTATVAYDPSDTTRVAFLPADSAPRILWRVPAVCPQCGGPVDQAVASMSDDPKCPHCLQPLPSEPVA